MKQSARQLTLVAEITTLAEADPGLPSGYDVRPTEPTDRLALADLYLHCYPKEIVADEKSAQDEMEATFRGGYGTLALDASPVVLCEGTVVGAVLVVSDAPWPDTPSGPFVIEVIVHPHHRRRRLAESALRWMATRLGATGARHVALRVMSDNAEALALYENLGFREWIGTSSSN